MSRKGVYFAAIVGALLFAGVSQALPAGETKNNWSLITTPASTTTAQPSSGWGSGWGSGSASSVSGDTSAFGQTVIVQDIAGINTQENPYVLEATASYDYTADIAVTQNQQADLEFNLNDNESGGGYVASGVGTAGADAPDIWVGQGAIYNSSVGLTGIISGGIIGDPQTSASMSMGSLVASTSGQVTNGTNVNQGANSGWGNTGSGWGNTGSGWGNNLGWRDQWSQTTSSTTAAPSTSGWGSGWGWPASQDGVTASASAVLSGTNLSQQATSSDNVTGIAVSYYDYGEASFQFNQSNPIAVEADFENNGVGVETVGMDGETQVHEVEIMSYPTNNATYSVSGTGVNATAFSIQPNSSTTISVGSIILSDFVTTSNGTHLVNQNNGWGSGWKSPVPEKS